MFKRKFTNERGQQDHQVVKKQATIQKIIHRNLKFKENANFYRVLAENTDLFTRKLAFVKDAVVKRFILTLSGGAFKVNLAYTRRDKNNNLDINATYFSLPKALFVVLYEMYQYRLTCLPQPPFVVPFIIQEDIPLELHRPSGVLPMQHMDYLSNKYGEVANGADYVQVSSNLLVFFLNKVRSVLVYYKEATVIIWEMLRGNYANAGNKWEMDKLAKEDDYYLAFHDFYKNLALDVRLLTICDFSLDASLALLEQNKPTKSKDKAFAVVEYLREIAEEGIELVWQKAIIENQYTYTIKFQADNRFTFEKGMKVLAKINQLMHKSLSDNIKLKHKIISSHDIVILTLSVDSIEHLVAVSKVIKIAGMSPRCFTQFSSTMFSHIESLPADDDDIKWYHGFKL